MSHRDELNRRRFLTLSALAAAGAPLGLAACNNTSTSPPTPLPTQPPGPSGPALPAGQIVPDLRFGFSPTPPTFPGYDPAGDAKALFIAGTPSPATSPVPGTLATGSYNVNERYVIKVPNNWNGKLAVVGTPSLRSEFASDFIWGDFLLANGYAWAASNKAIPYNAIIETAPTSTDPTKSFPVCFNLANLETLQITVKFGALNAPGPVLISTWNQDFIYLTQAAQKFLYTYFGKTPTRTYAVGTSNGGAQVRSLIESRPDLIDGGVDWEGVYWSPGTNLFTYIPQFLQNMPAYIQSNFTDPVSSAAIRAAGFAPDITQPGSATHPSLWLEYYSNQTSFYMDLTLFAYSLLVDPTVSSNFGVPMATPNPINPVWLPGTINGSGMAIPANRASYVPSGQAISNIQTWQHTGKIGKPLITVAGVSDVLVAVTPNATGYLNAVRAAGKSSQYWQYLVQGGTHLDTFTPFYPGMQPILPFAWAAFNQMVSIVEKGFNPQGAGAQQTVSTPSQIVSM
ncbi:MAG: hypothetical protein JO359_08925 [Candidatus Eremiobacteraeota bacterium]|nr:hypothetical protein [Candidatus Eremiobacteraeota bacterium]